MKRHLKSYRYMAEQIIAVVEKVLGTGFDPVTDDVLVNELTHLLQEDLPHGTMPPIPTPDAHLEMAFEDRICGTIE